MTMDRLRDSRQYGDIVVNNGTSHFGDINNIVQNVGVDVHERRREQIRSSLRFPELNARRNDIAISEFAAYDWFFDVDEGDVLEDARGQDGRKRGWPSFRLWLQQTQGAYVVQGKPGSGKSTFMKYIAWHRKTSFWLRNWAGPRHVQILFHSFWAVGSKLQNNMRGFLASLLYQILEDPFVADIAYQTSLNKHHLNN